MSVPTPTPAQRQWLYAVITALVPILVVYGIVDDNSVTLWLALAAAVLGTGTAFAHTRPNAGTGGVDGEG
ncbi:holin [Gordonia phage Powerball]|uniref:Membrane protein n=1 Tax=Gordonia phage Powerball TaxID=2599847 RepID=A0A5J6TU33_9CAUD|nr:holin [Gordonia phage Powerball]QFG13457.1 membrane protein [Gordonia phage Powerball]